MALRIETRNRLRAQLESFKKQIQDVTRDSKNHVRAGEEGERDIGEEPLSFVCVLFNYRLVVLYIHSINQLQVKKINNKTRKLIAADACYTLEQVRGFSSKANLSKK